MLKRIRKDEKELAGLQEKLNENQAQKEELSRKHEEVMAAISAAATAAATTALNHSAPAPGAVDDMDAEGRTASSAEPMSGDTGGVDAMQVVEQEEVEPQPSGVVTQPERQAISSSDSPVDGSSGGGTVVEDTASSLSNVASMISTCLMQLELEISEREGSVHSLEMRLDRARAEEEELRSFFSLPIEGMTAVCVLKCVYFHFIMTCVGVSYAIV